MVQNIAAAALKILWGFHHTQLANANANKLFFMIDAQGHQLASQLLVLLLVFFRRQIVAAETDVVLPEHSQGAEEGMMSSTGPLPLGQTPVHGG